MGKLEDYTKCDLCSKGEQFSEKVLSLAINSSERAFWQEKFTVWQCGNCKCIHAKEGVDLNHYYSQYALHGQDKLDAITSFFFGKKLKFLVRGGLQKDHIILDYGCGSGLFVTYMKQQGYSKVHGYDPFTEKFNDKTLLNNSYDFIMSSDVIEHDLSPNEHLDKLIVLAPEGIIYIQTPNADGIDLRKKEKNRQVLQQPFHRHIVSLSWMIERMKEKDREAVLAVTYPFFHSWLPFLNLPVLDYYADSFGGLAALSEPFHWQALTKPKYWFLAFFGAFFRADDSMQVVFKKPKQS